MNKDIKELEGRFKATLLSAADYAEYLEMQSANCTPWCDLLRELADQQLRVGMYLDGDNTVGLRSTGRCEGSMVDIFILNPKLTLKDGCNAILEIVVPSLTTPAS